MQPIVCYQHAPIQFGSANVTNMQIDKSMISKVSDGRGFTLIELIVVLALLAMLASVSVPKFIDLSVNTAQKALQAGVAELNSRENLC